MISILSKYFYFSWAIWYLKECDLFIEYIIVSLVFHKAATVFTAWWWYIVPNSLFIHHYVWLPGGYSLARKWENACILNSIDEEHFSNCLSSVCLLPIYIFIFFCRTTGPIILKLGTKHPWMNGIGVCSNKGPTQVEIITKLQKFIDKIFKIFSRIIWPKLTKIGTKHPWINGIQLKQLRTI